MSNTPVMSGNLLAISEQVIGLVLNGVQTPTLFNAERLHGKYQAVMKDIQAGKSEPELILKYGNLIQPAKYAAKSVNGMGESLDWVDYLDKAWSAEVISQYLEKASKHVAVGDMDKFDSVLRLVNSARQSSLRLRSIAADEITNHYDPFIKSGTLAWDNHIGGFPNVGIVVIGAEQGKGKTTSGIQLMANFLKQYPEKTGLFVTLEDMSDGWKQRASIILGKHSDEFWHKVKVMEFANNADEIIEEASRYDDLGIIVLDYVDYLVSEPSLPAYSEVYRTLAKGSKSLAVSNKWRSMPIIMLAQFGRGAYQGGVPTKNALLFTGEQYAYQLVMLYNPHKDFYSDNMLNPFTLETKKDMGYVVVWKVKNGNRPHLIDPDGAISVPLAPTGGLNLNFAGTWHSLSPNTKRATPQRK